MELFAFRSCRALRRRCLVAAATVGFLGLGCCVLLAGCATFQIKRGPKLDVRARWALLPVINHSETPQAGEKVEDILSALLRGWGIGELTLYPAPGRDDGGALPELDERRRQEAAIVWARKAGFKYGVTGTVEEWRYRSGLDGEPAVGLTLQVLDLSSGQVLWSAMGARAGWGREILSATAQYLISSLLGKFERS